MPTVSEAARRIGLDPETIKRWIRPGKLRARKIGTQHLIKEEDPREAAGEHSSPIPKSWDTFPDGKRMPDWEALVLEVRREMVRSLTPLS